MVGPLASPHSETVLLDVAGGTGDIAFRLHESLTLGFRRPGSCPRIIVCDINPSMLAVGKSRAEEKGFLGEAVFYLYYAADACRGYRACLC